MTDKRLVLTTCGSVEEARHIAQELVQRRLAACVNIIPQIESVYRWKGEVDLNRPGTGRPVVRASRSTVGNLQIAGRRALECSTAVGRERGAPDERAVRAPRNQVVRRDA